MANYAKVLVRAKFSRNSDYSHHIGPEALTMVLTPDEAIHRIFNALTGGVEILKLNEYPNTAAIGTCQLILRNNDSTNFVTVGYTDTEAGAQTPVVPAGSIIVVPDIDNSTATGAAVTVTADTASCECEILLMGT